MNEGAGSPINGNSSNSAGIHMKSLYKQGQLKEALRLLHLMDYRGIAVDASYYASLLQGCANIKTLTEGKLVHAHMVHSGFQLDILLGTELLIMYAKCGRLDDARRFWCEMPERSVGSWRALIVAYARHGFYEEALSLFYKMKRSGIEPDQFTFATVLPVCANMVALECGKEIHEEIIRNGFQCNVFVGSALVDMYAKCGRIEDARIVFDKMPERNVVSWNSMIAGYVKNRQADDALKLFRQMTERNLVSWNTMIAGFVQTGRLDEAMGLFEAMPERNVVSWTAMVSGYAQNGHIDKAMKLFQEMPERNMVSWNAMIAGLARNGYCDEALKFFRQMKLTSARPDLDTYASTLSACAKLAALEHGREIHEEITRSGFHSDVFVETALVDMYGKCGSIEDARKVFDKMYIRNRVSWNVMILVYAMHGYGKDALQQFEQMQLSGTNPDQATFVGVLFACCHAGLVDDGRRYFELMRQYHHITPTVDHYCCMVDLLGRSGYLDEARNLIDKMPLKPDAAVWVSLLGACRVHTNLELGEYVAKLLFLSDSEISAPYVLLSNLYAAAGEANPVYKQVPVLIHNGRSVSQSLVILEYIEETWPLSETTPSLLPASAYGKSLSRFWADFANKKFIETGLKLMKKFGEEHATARKEIVEQFMTLEEGMRSIGSEGPFFLGERMTLADVALAPLVSWLPSFEALGELKFPGPEQCGRMHKWLHAMGEHPNVVASVPPADWLLQYTVNLRQDIAEHYPGGA